MRFYSLLILYIFSQVSSALSALVPREVRGPGYECGVVFFDDKLINNAVIRATNIMNFGYHPGIEDYPPFYQGPLFPENEQYRVVPITKTGDLGHISKTFSNTYRAVVDKDFSVKGFLVRTTKNHFTRCIRIDPESSDSQNHNIDQSNGYECGHDFFSDDLISNHLEKAREKIGQGEPYPAPYVGPLYDKSLNFMIWPLFDRGKVFRQKDQPNNLGSFYLVLNPDGKLMDILIRQSNLSFTKCIRTKKIFSAPANDPLSNIFAPPPRFGYQCDLLFFEDSEINLAAKAAKMPDKASNYLKYPFRYNGPPYKRPCLLWPLLKNKIYSTGYADKYRLVMKPNYEVIGAAILVGQNLVPCERTQIIGKKIHEKHDFRCGNTIFLNSRLVEVAAVACSKLPPRSRGFPARFNQLEFEMKGPYIIYPLFQFQEYKTGSAGKYRVVINDKCELIGVLQKKGDELSKCKKIKKNLIPDLNASIQDETNDEEES